MADSPKDKKPSDNKDEPKTPPRASRPNPFFTASTWWVMAAMAIIAAFIFYSQSGNSRSEISYGVFRA